MYTYLIQHIKTYILGYSVQTAFIKNLLVFSYFGTFGTVICNLHFFFMIIYFKLKYNVNFIKVPKRFSNMAQVKTKNFA